MALLSRDEILAAWTRLGALAHGEGKLVEIIVVGGAVMAVLFRSRPSTADVDGIFEPAADTRRWAQAVADERGLAADWLNDGAKGYVNQPSAGPLLHESDGITVRTLAFAQLLALKLMAWRDDVDFDDALNILRALATEYDCSSRREGLAIGHAVLRGVAPLESVVRCARALGAS